MTSYNLKVSLPKIRVPFSFCGRTELAIPNILLLSRITKKYKPLETTN